MVYFYTVMETLEDERMESIVEDYWRKFEWFVDEDRIDYLVNFTVKVIDYRFRFLLSQRVCGRGAATWGCPRRRLCQFALPS